MDRPRQIPDSSSHPHHPTLFASLHKRTRTVDATAAEKAREARANATREAKRYLLQIVRNDWSYDPPATSSGPSSSSASSEAESPSPIPKDRDVLEWRMRGEDSSNSDGEQNARDEATDPYRFESPDAVQAAMLERRRKRRKLIEDEMKWNPGLRLWIQRRDAWTGAKVPPKKTAGVEAALKPRTSSDESAGGSCNDDDDLETAGPSSRPLSADSLSNAVTDAALPAQSLPLVDDTISKSTVTVPHTEPFADSEEPLVPIVPPILPSSNPFRTYTTPSNYPAIYNKLVIEGNMPAVPVNLLHMTRALVQGWKREGQWPPKPTITKDVPVVRKKRPQLQTESNGKAIAAILAAPPAPAEEHTSRRKSISSNVTGAVKKVFGFASIHSGHRFHVRAHSQSSASSPIVDPNAEGSKPGNRKDL
ncbi:uncharacterized protein CIMG_05150 [Coccidioides immitis RS]|uniref:Gag1-like clamp domain-containing protein n=1 Tax=Coccidioides immitis (strain RS) TaxID=246410 RepID=J3KEZ2_COCIM|nr:uncharacterized protein CIMG_05150 [Coccidioides immitis RS]EAS34126.3 hypothetical protein CIMG_05150 [Coccidioides immitis RS]TPX21693.1 hypothetical protein DIZ76_015655 [Coccidioides immitis]